MAIRRVLVVAIVLLVVGGVCLALPCPKCKKDVKPGSKFCASCGQKVNMVFQCAKCKGKIEYGVKFCSHCGVKLQWDGGAKPKPPKPKPPTPKPPSAEPMSSADIFAKASPAVVRIEIKDKAGKRIGIGSGFIVSAEGHVLTNYHVIAKAWSATVILPDKKQMPVLGYAGVDPGRDLALLRVNGRGLAHLELAAGPLPKIGTKVCTIGHPRGLPTLSEGIVSGQPKLTVSGKPVQYLQTTAAISVGSSGGPLLTGYGKVLVVGVTTGSVRGGQNLNMAVPAVHCRELMKQKTVIRRLPPPRVNVPVATRPAPRPAERKRLFADPFDRDVQKAIDRALAYLWSQQKEAGNWARLRKVHGQFDYPAGSSALVCFALLEGGVPAKDKRMARALRWLARQKVTKTYTLALRANAWKSASKTVKTYEKNLATDVKVLIQGTRNGGYSYDCPSTGLVPDNSNAQYGLLGVWAGAAANLEEIQVPMKYWDLVNRYWTGQQLPDGGWGYAKFLRPKSYPSMTVAGLASLFVCHDHLMADKFSKCGANAGLPAIDKGLAYLDKSIKRLRLDSTIPQGGKVSRVPLDMYYLFGIERVGLASGYKYFGGLDWYKVGAKRIMKDQQPDGSMRAGGWCDSTTATAYALLFLVRGRHPVIFNKLKFPSDWNNRPRDLAALTRWMSKTFERRVNWQVIDLNHPVEQWHDAPILYISGSRPPGFTDDHVAALRTFVQQGGTIFSCTECGGMGFRTGIRKAYAAMFPKYPLTALGAKHELFSVHFPIRGSRFYMISNGIRPLVIHTDFDLPLGWQTGKTKTRAWTFRIAANIAMYATGKGAFRPRGVTVWPAKKDFEAAKTVKLARLKHGGDWDPEPLAYERFSRLVAQRAKIKVDIAGPIEIEDLPRSGAQLATLTGTGKLTLTDKQRKALKDFAAGGGTLFIDAAGGSGEFDKSARAILSEMYPSKLRTLSAGSALYKQAGLEISDVRYRGLAKRRLVGQRVGALRAVMVGGRPAVIYSREDVTAALVGFESSTCDGYQPDSAYLIMRNIVAMAAK